MVKEKSRGWKSVLSISLFIFLILFAYAVIRYNVIKGVPVSSIPLYIFNKAVAITAVFLIGISYLIGSFARFWPKRFASKLNLEEYFGLLGFGLAVVHAIISLLLFNPYYYPKFFDKTGMLNLEGELSMFFGVIALFIFSIVAVTSIQSIEKSMDYKKWLMVQRLGYIALILVMFHVFVMGFKGWLKPADWPGGLLPISLIAFAAIAFVLLIKLIAMILPERK